MIRSLIILFLCINVINAQETVNDVFKKHLKFSTIYAAVNGGTSVSDVRSFSVVDGLQTSMIETPYDYSVTLGIRKIARFGY